MACAQFIKRKESLYKFYRYIGFENYKKQDKLKELLSRWDGSNIAGAFKAASIAQSGRAHVDSQETTNPVTLKVV